LKDYKVRNSLQMSMTHPTQGVSIQEVMTWKLSMAIFLLVVVQLLVPFLAFSDEGENQEPPVYSVGEVVVTGKTGGVEATETVLEVTEQDIRDSGARNLVEAIDHLPGLHVFTGGRGVPRISIRGFRPRQVLLLHNGIPFNAAYDQQFDPTAIPTENIAKIKVTEGPSSVLYGQGANGGVINIVTKKGTEGIKGMVGGEVGEGNSYLGKASLSGAHKKLDFFVSGSSYTRDAFPLSRDFTPTSEQGKGDRNNSDDERHSIFGNVGYGVHEDLDLYLTFNYLEGEYGIPGGVINPPDLFAPSPKYERIDHFEGLSVQLAVDYRLSESFGLRAWAFRNELVEHDNRYDNSSFNSFDDPLVNRSFKLERKTAMQGLSLQPKYVFGDKATLTLGVSAELDQWDSRGSIKDQFGGWPPANYYRRVDADEDFTLYAVMLEYEYTPIPKLGLVAGYGHHWQDREDFSDNDGSILFGAHYDVTDSTRLKAAFQKSIRFPDLRQLYDEESGNQALKTERTTHYTLGVEQQLPWKNSHISLDAFHSIPKDFIQKDRLDTGLFQNFEEYEFTGFDLASEIGGIENLMLRASYSYLHTKDLATEGKDELQYRPENRITVQGRYTFAFGFTANVSLVYVADQYAYSKAAIAPGEYLKKKLDDYTVVNVKLSQSLWHDRITLYVGADNILDEYYEETYALPQAGQVIFAGMETRF
jgi:vitamin B12 transporter